LLKKLADSLSDIAKIEQHPKMEGKWMTMILAADKSLKKKASSKNKDQENKQ